jgi:hypothetical protein
MNGNAMIEAAADAARPLGLAAAHLLAVAEVETGLNAGASVGGRVEPLIRFEGLYFDRRLSGEKLARARAEGLASPTAGAIANPSGQAARWRMLERAAAIDRKAAWESTSWGLGQVMGAHWAWLGYVSVDALAADARAGIAGQFRLMALYIDKASLADTLRRADWQAFARGYNGPAFRRNAYDTKIAAAYARHAAGGTGLPGTARSVLRRGMRGEDVATLQGALAALGHALAEDGVFGPLTDAAVRRFQATHGLTADGIVGPLTRAAIEQVGRLSTIGTWLGSFIAWLGARLGSR